MIYIQRKGNTAWESILLISLDTFMLLAVMGITLGIIFMVVNADIPNKKIDIAPEWGTGETDEEANFNQMDFLRALTQITTTGEVDVPAATTYTISRQRLESFMASQHRIAGRAMVVLRYDEGEERVNPEPDVYHLEVNGDERVYTYIYCRDRKVGANGDIIIEDYPISFDATTQLKTSDKFILNVPAKNENDPVWNAIKSWRGSR